MERSKLEEIGQRKVPWCAVCLITAIIGCQIGVLVGNLQMASVINTLGDSTSGWSSAGLGVARSLDKDLNAAMEKASDHLLDSLKQITVVQDLIDIAMSVMGNATENAAQTGQRLSLLQAGRGMVYQPNDAKVDLNTELDKLVPMIMNVVHTVLADIMKKASDAINFLLQKLRPVLAQVNDWIIRFGPDIQNGVETFSVTLDKVNALFNQVTSQAGGTGSGKEAMLQETFNLFDVSNTGSVTLQDLQDVSSLYSITALGGLKAQELHSKYDTNADGGLDRREMAELVEDSSVPNIMAAVLRTYARRLAEVSGTVRSAKHRDEVAQSVVRYFQLVCSKNKTKLGWVSDALGNGSLPLAFSADVMAQLCLSQNDPSILTTEDVGSVVVQNMYKMHPERTLDAIEQLSNITFWEDEGFNLVDQPACVRKVKRWLQDHYQKRSKALSMVQTDADKLEERLDAIPLPTDDQVAVYLNQQNQQLRRKHEALYSSRASQVLLVQLLGGVPASDITVSSVTSQVLKSGQLALPETLAFATWLGNNASITAERFQDLCYEYTQSASSPIDAFATTLQEMRTRIQAFLDMMYKYATDAGVAKLERQVQRFAKNAGDEVIKVLEAHVQGLIEEYQPAIAEAIHTAAREVGHKFGMTLGDSFSEALEGDLGKVLSTAMDNNATGKRFASKLAPYLGEMVSKGTDGMVSSRLSQAVDNMIVLALREALQKTNGSSQPPPHPELVRVAANNLELAQARLEGKAEQAQVVPALDGAWQSMVSVLKQLAATMPQAIKSLKSARMQVGSLGSSMSSVLIVLSNRAVIRLDSIAGLWRGCWVGYFFLLLPLLLVTLLYALWASGFFGGPQPVDEDGQEFTSASLPLSEKVSRCCFNCVLCCRRSHDTEQCFWTGITLMTIILMVVLVVAIVLVILGSIKMMLHTGCSQLYILADQDTCGEHLMFIKRWLSDFYVVHPAETLSSICMQKRLLTCNLIDTRLATSSMTTICFSILSFIFMMQLMVESAMLHERARMRRLVATALSSEALTHDKKSTSTGPASNTSPRDEN